jgi:hypothetical protein
MIKEGDTWSLCSREFMFTAAEAPSVSCGMVINSCAGLLRRAPLLVYPLVFIKWAVDFFMLEIELMTSIKTVF